MKIKKPKFWDKRYHTLFSIILWPISFFYQIIISIKKSATSKKEFSIPIICVGNIYIGGTGKTPLCIEVFKILKSLKINASFVKKYYEKLSDETKLLENISKVFTNKQRSEAIKSLINNKFQVAILDDGFQDPSIKSDISIVCFNEKQWIGNGLTIPSGPLREGLYALKRADCVIINGKKNKNIENKIFSKNEKIKIFYSSYKPQNIDEFQNKKVVAFAGIGNPQNFFDLAIENKLDIAETIEFPDHHKYSEKELVNLSNKIKDKNSILVTTEKDYFRISEDHKKNIKYLKIEVEIENKNQFIENIKKII